MMYICHACRREVKPGQRVIQNHIFQFENGDARPKLTNMGLQHASCYDPDINDPRYDENGNEIDSRREGYVAIKERKLDD